MGLTSGAKDLAWVSAVQLPVVFVCTVAMLVRGGGSSTMPAERNQLDGSYQGAEGDAGATAGSRRRPDSSRARPRWSGDWW